MSFTIDENKVNELLVAHPEQYSITPINLAPITIESEAPSCAVYGTIPNAAPASIGDMKERLLSLRRRIVESGVHLMTTEELDRETATRKRQSER
jgi:hypothetical protein